MSALRAAAARGPLAVAFSLLLLGACATPHGSGPPSQLPTMVVAIVGLDQVDLGTPDAPSTASLLPHLAKAAEEGVRWTDALSPAPGFRAVTGMLSTEPNPTPLPPRRLRAPGDRAVRWLTVAPRLASRPEARRLVDPAAVGRSWPLPRPDGSDALWVAIFDPLDSLETATPDHRRRRWHDFDRRLQQWRADTEREMGPVRWWIVGVAPPPADDDLHGRTPVARPLLWMAPGLGAIRHSHRVLTDDLPGALERNEPSPRLPPRSRRPFRWAGRSGGEILRESADGRSWEVVPPPFRELELWVRGEEEVSVVDLRIEVTGGIESVRPISLEAIDDVLRPDAATVRLQLATGRHGDGVRLRPRRPDAWLRLHLLSRISGTGLLGAPFHAGPTGRELGRRRVELAPLSRDWWRVQTTKARRRGELGPGVHLWLLPPGSAGE